MPICNLNYPNFPYKSREPCQSKISQLGYHNCFHPTNCRISLAGPFESTEHYGMFRRLRTHTCSKKVSYSQSTPSHPTTTIHHNPPQSTTTHHNSPNPQPTTKSRSVVVVAIGACTVRTKRCCNHTLLSIRKHKRNMSTKWKAMASMSTERGGAGCAAIDDNRFVVLGGWSDKSLLSSSEMYDRSSNEWAELPNDVPDGGLSRHGHSVTVSIDNKVYFMGGVSGIGETNLLFALDTETLEWETLPCMKERRLGWAAVAVGRFIYVFGDYGNDTAERYNVDEKKWEDLTSMPTKRGQSAAVAIQNKIYVIGGQESIGGKSLASVEVFDVDKQTWESPSTVKDMSVARSRHTAVVLGGRFVVVMGGTYGSRNDTKNSLSSVEVLDTATGSWTTSPHSMTRPRCDHGAVVLGDNNIYVAGGYGVDYALNSCESMPSSFFLPYLEVVRSPALINDSSRGVDCLGVARELRAIAQTLLHQDLSLPYVLAVLGGWGSGKSFAFEIILQYIMEIQKINLTDKYYLENDPPFCGHIYYVKFDSWTFAKGNLWASLMHQILVSLNDQLHLESLLRKADPNLLRQGVSTIEIMEELTTGEFKYLQQIITNEELIKDIKEMDIKNNNITKSLINATNVKYKEDYKKLQEKKKELAWKLTCDQPNSNTKILPEIKRLLGDAFTKYKNKYKNSKDPVPQTVQDGIEKTNDSVPQTVQDGIEKTNDPVPQTVQDGIEKTNNPVPQTVQDGIEAFNFVEKYWHLCRAGELSTLWVAVVAVSVTVAVAIPLLISKVEALWTTVAPLAIAFAAKVNDTKAKLADAQVILSKAIHDADSAQLQSENEDLEAQQGAIQTLKAEVKTLQDRVWLVEGDSIDRVVKDRIDSGDYEKQLGVVHQAQMDLKRLSDAMFSNAKHDKTKDMKDRIFPRGDPRIVLFIDDLDRCPPNKVMETLEAIQLLVKTDLFVVVIAIDARYVTLALEDAYAGILDADRHPSGLDYLEKIIQLGYRIPPIQTEEAMRDFIRAQIGKTTEELQEEVEQKTIQEAVRDEIRRSNAKGEEETKEKDAEEEQDGSNTKEKQTPFTNKGTSSEVHKIPKKIFSISNSEAEMLEEACLAADVSPRAGKRLVNVFKLMKLIWYQVEEDGTSPPSDDRKKVFVLLLALSASTKKSIRLGMCKYFSVIEEKRSVDLDSNDESLLSLLKEALGGEDKKLPASWERCRHEVERSLSRMKWKDTEEWKNVKNDLRIVRAFSFVGEYAEAKKRVNRKIAPDTVSSISEQTEIE